MGKYIQLLINFCSSMKKWGNIFNLIKNAEILPTFVRKQWKTSELIFLRKMGTCTQLIQVLLQTNEFVVNWIEKIFSFIYPNFNSKFSSNQFRSMNFYSSQKSFLTYIQLLNPKSFQINLNVSVSWNLNYQPKR